MGKIVIQGFHVSRKWFEVKSPSRLIHVNFIHNPSLVAKSLQQCEDLTRGCHFGQKVDLGGKNTFYSQSVLHHFLSIFQFLDFSNLILNRYFEVNFVTCQDGWVVRALDSHARDPWFKSLWHQAFLFRKCSQKFFKKWLSIRRITIWIPVEVNLCRPLLFTFELLLKK